MRSGLAHHFFEVEIVSEKNTESYARLLKRHNIAPGNFLMVGNSLRSDILPVLELGASAVHVPYALTWVLESADSPPDGQPGFYIIDHLGMLPELIEKLERKTTIT
jgi:putative hydrolase of the HAD superfamily